MPGISNNRKRLRESLLKAQEAKKAKRRDPLPENKGQKVVHPRNKLKPGRKKKVVLHNVLTRNQAKIQIAEQKEMESILSKSQNGRDKIAAVRRNVKEIAKERRDRCAEMHKQLKLKNQRQRINQQQEIINELQEIMSFSTLRASSGSEPSPCLFEPLSVITEAAPTSKSTASSPTEHDNIDFQRFQSVSPTLNVQSSTRIKNRIGLSHRKYETLRRELAVEGIKMPSPSTIRRNENRIFDDHFQNSDKPDFYGLVNKAVSKYDFSTFENVRITIGGDGGGDGEKSSVKIVCFFNDIELPLSVKKLIIIWSYVGKETGELLEPVLKLVDADILKLKQKGIMTRSGLKNVIITYVGDCKFQCTSLSLQGGSSVCGCSHCIIKRSKWPTVEVKDIIPRTIENILEHAEQVICNNGNPKMHGSVKNFPLIRNIPITHFVPPPVHILISLVNEIIAYIRKIEGEKYSPLEEFLKGTGAKLHFPAKTYNGNECRNILRHFREEKSKRIMYNGCGKELFEAASNIEKFAVARSLLNDEIEALESNINLFFNLVKVYGNDAMKFFLNKTKIHMLKEHVIPFVKMFRSWGLFSEESVESIHHVRNELDDRIPGNGPEIGEKRNNFFMKNQAIALHYS